jgi:hypothetical protein
MCLVAAFLWYGLVFRGCVGDFGFTQQEQLLSMAMLRLQYHLAEFVLFSDFKAQSELRNCDWKHVIASRY